MQRIAGPVILLLLPLTVVPSPLSAQQSTCNFTTVFQLTDYEFWGPDLPLLDSIVGSLNNAPPAPGETFVSPTIGYTFVHTLGKVNQPFLLFTHGGFPGNFNSYCEILVHAASHGFAVLFVRKMNTAVNVEDYVADVRAVVHHVTGGNDPNISTSWLGTPGVQGQEWTSAGHSFGGAAAIYMAQDPRFTRVISMEPMEGLRLFGDPTLTDGAVRSLPHFTGDYIVINGDVDEITSPDTANFWYELATSARRRTHFHVPGMGHYGPMSIGLFVGGFDPVQGTIVPDTVQFPDQLRLHKRILIAAMRSDPLVSERDDTVLYSRIMTEQVDFLGVPFTVEITADFERPIAWAFHDGDRLSLGMVTAEDDHTAMEWRSATGPWTPIRRWPTLLGPTSTHEIHLPVPADIVPKLFLRGVATRGAATFTTTVLRP